MSHTADAGRSVAGASQGFAESEILALVRRAAGHELGMGFLKEGAQDAVAAVFDVHAFLVDAARDYLASQQPAS